MTDRITVGSLRCEYLDSPLGIDTMRPRLSWQLSAARRGVLQSAYQVVVWRAEREDCTAWDCAEWDCAEWDSGKVASGESTGITYGGPELVSRQAYCWKVRVWDESGAVSAWGPVASWEMGLLRSTDWIATWIEPLQERARPEPHVTASENLGIVSPGTTDYSRLNPSQYLRKIFGTRGPVRQARIYATAHGVYRLEINGARVGGQELAPEVTAYDRYLQYQTYDVTGLIREGGNVLGAILGDGWYCGRIGLPGDSCQYGDRLALLLQLEIDYEDGSREWVLSDGRFRSTTGPLVYSDLFIGERYDARLEFGGWCEPDYDDSAWNEVIVADYGHANLVAQYGEPLRGVREIAAQRIIETPRGETVIDIGQNIAGKVRMRVQGPAGTEVMLDYSEVLDAEGNFLQQLRGRNKDQRDVYVLKGEGVEVYEPYFTMHGFRYVRVSGYPGRPRPEDFTGLVIASDLRQSGTFACSDERINRLQENIVWSQRGNFVSIPTDCPQRERAGFTGDAQVFIPTACFNMNVAAFFTRWLRNLQLEQREDGQVPVTAPYWKSYAEMFAPVQGGSHTSAGWGDACIIVPWTLYQAYGDLRVLEENYATMTRWLEYVRREAEVGIPERLHGELSPESRERHRYLWNTGFHFGDWLIPSLTGGYQNPFEAAKATIEVAATAFYALSTSLMSRIAAALGMADDARRYASLNARIRDAFAAEYIGSDGRLPAHYQGMYVLALRMNLVPEDMRAHVTGQLVRLIEENGCRLDTGFVSVPYLLDVLCEADREDLAYRLLFQTECPSWLYELEKGATTLWESWDAIAPDGRVNLASFNHYSFGCVGDWLYRYVAGLDKDQAGYRHIVIAPHPHPRLTWAEAAYESVYGETVSQWELADGKMRLSVTIPANTTATIRLPGAPTSDAVEVGSGSYVFEVPYG